MTSDEKMSINERYKYLRRMQERYRQASDPENRQLLACMSSHPHVHKRALRKHKHVSNNKIVTVYSNIASPH